MSRWLLSCLLVVGAAHCLLAEEPAATAADKKDDGSSKGCSKWVFDACKPVTGDCGPGKQHAKRSGVCETTEGIFDCEVPCQANLIPALAEVDTEQPQGDDPMAEGEGRNGKKGRRGGRNKVNKKGKGGKRGNKGADKCRYTKGQKGECDETTGMRSMTLTLKKGPETCEQSKTVTRPCKKAGGGNGGRGGRNKDRRNKDKENKDKPACKYEKAGATWTECQNDTVSLTLTLKKGDAENCEPTKTITKKCPRRRTTRGASACRYTRGEWSECNTDKNEMTRTLTLKKGDAETCEATKTITRACKREKCSFGGWGDWSECTNGVKTKTRPVSSGGDKCEKRAVKTKPCKSRGAKAKGN